MPPNNSAFINTGNTRKRLTRQPRYRNLLKPRFRFKNTKRVSMPNNYKLTRNNLNHTKNLIKSRKSISNLSMPTRGNVGLNERLATRLAEIEAATNHPKNMIKMLANSKNLSNTNKTLLKNKLRFLYGNNIPKFSELWNKDPAFMQNNSELLEE